MLAFLAFGLLMAALACAPPQVLDFDASTRTVRGRARRLLGWSRAVALVFDNLQPPRVQAHERESQGPLHQVRIGVHGEPPLLLGAFDDPTKPSFGVTAWSSCWQQQSRNGDPPGLAIGISRNLN